MKTLENRVISTWGEKGKTWLNQLPGIITQLCEHWHLSDLELVENLSYNYVAKAKQNNRVPVILKISCDSELMADECRALKHFKGEGSVKVLDSHTALNALLLEQAIPGDLLKQNHPKNIKDTINIYAGIVSALASQPIPANERKHVSKWCQAIDNIQDPRINPQYIEKAKMLRDFLLSSAEKEYLCHGDLHLDNIIQHGDKWLSIDPKGILGEMAFEAAAFDLTDKDEEEIFRIINLLANALDLNKDRLLGWIFLRAIISAQWFIEDKGDPTEKLKLAATLYPILNKKKS